MYEIVTPERVREWFKDKPKEWDQVIAVRTASRLLPVINQIFKQKIFNDQRKNKSTITIMRAFLVSEVALQYPNSKITKSLSAARAATKDLAKVSVSATRTVALAASASSTAYALRAASITLANNAAQKILSIDLKWLENDKNTLQTLPLWSEQQNLLEKDWTSLKKALLSLDPNWRFWIDWYQAKLDGTTHPDLTMAQQDKLYHTIAAFPNDLWEQGAEAVNARIAELVEEVKEETEDEEQSEEVDTLESPEELPGPHMEIIDSEVELVEIKTEVDDQFDHEVQEILRSKLLKNVRSLLEDNTAIDNQYPGLITVLQEYQQQLEKNLDELNSAEFWAHSVALMAQSKAFLSQNEKHTLTPALEPSLAAKLEEIAQLNGGFVLGFPKPKILTDQKNQALSSAVATLQEPVLEAIYLFQTTKDLFGDKLEALLNVIEKSIQAGGWKYARLEFSATSTVHNILLELGRLIIKIDQAVLKSGTVTIVFGTLVSQQIPGLNPSTLQAIWDVMLGHPSIIANFTAPFPELQNWMNYVIERAKVLKKDCRINNKDNKS